MKTRLVAAVMLGVVSVSAAPSHAQLDLFAGLEGGYLKSTFDYGAPLPEWDVGSNDGFTAGITVELRTPSRIGIVGGFRFVRYTNHVDFESDIVSIKGYFEVTQDYVSWPLYLKYLPFSDFGWFILGGGELGFLVSADQESKSMFYGTPDTTITMDNDIIDRMERTNIALLVGGGYEFALGSHTVILQARYNYGLVGTAEEKDWLSDWKIRAVEIIAGFAW